MKLKRFSLPLILMVLGLSGCYAFNNLDELSVIGEYSREKDNQNRLVQANNDHYDALTKIIANGHISDYKDESSFVTSFGPPILKKGFRDGIQRWLYRYAIYKTAKDKVYVYFDRSRKMVKWEKLPCPKLF